MVVDSTNINAHFLCYWCYCCCSCCSITISISKFVLLMLVTSYLLGHVFKNCNNLISINMKFVLTTKRFVIQILSKLSFWKLNVDVVWSNERVLK